MSHDEIHELLHAYADGELLYRRNDNHALGAVENGLGNIIGNIQDFLQNFTRMFHAVLFLLLGLDCD